MTNCYHRAHTVATVMRELLVIIRPLVPARYRDDVDVRIAQADSFIADLEATGDLGARTLTSRRTAATWLEDTLAEVETLAARAALPEAATRRLVWLRGTVPFSRGQLEAGD